MPQEVKPYHPEGEKKDQVEKMFNRIAPHYDGLNRFLSLGIDVVWRRKAVRTLQAPPEARILDVATGTADVALEIYRQHRPKEILGVDIANQMLDIGRRKIQKKNWEEAIQLEQGDSENLRFADNTFDGATVAFGVRNFQNLSKGLGEIYRVLKPGGQLVVLEFSKPRIFPLKQVYHFYFRNILPLIGRFTSRDPRAYAYLYESVQAFPDGDAFEAELKKSGYTITACKPLTFGICSVYWAQK